MWLKRKLRKNSIQNECITIVLLGVTLIFISVYYIEPKIETFFKSSDVKRAQKHHLRGIVKVNKNNEELSMQMDEYDEM